MTRTVHDIALDISCDIRPRYADAQVLYDAAASHLRRQVALIQTIHVLKLCKQGIANRDQIVAAIEAGEAAL